MTLRLTRLALLVLPCALFAACSSTTIVTAAPQDDGGGGGDDQGDGGPAGDDGGAKKDGQSSGFPAAHPATPKVTSYGGPVLKTPRIVPMIFSGDAYANDIKTFTQKIGGSAYWKAATTEYGVGAATAVDPIVLTVPAPGDITDDDVQTFLASQLDGTHAVGQPDANSIYAIYYPSSTTISDGSGTSCQQFGGYHNETQVGSTHVAYAVLPRCSGSGFGVGTDLDTLTIASSHEFIEAATDPFPQNNPAYGIVDMDHLVWALFPLPEVGDMCTFAADAYFKPSEIGYTVQRTWSNASAAAGHNPCVPAASGVYFNAVPVLKEKIPMDFGSGQSADTLGVKVAQGKSATVDLVLYSDGPTSGEWNVAVYDMGQYMGGTQELSFGLDKDTGKNGDTLKLTITRKANGQYGGSEFMIVSSLGKTQQSTYFGFAGN